MMITRPDIEQMTLSGEPQIHCDSQQGSSEQETTIPCLRCGICCTKWQPPVDEAEIATIAHELGIPQKEFYCHYVQPYPLRPNIFLIRCKDGICIFLTYKDRQASCAIHPSRAAACRDWTPSLSRPECQEGLRRQGDGHKLIQQVAAHPHSGKLAD